MARIAMANLTQCRSSGVMVVVALFFALAVCAGMVGGASCDDGDDTVPGMVTLEQRAERRLATALVWCVAKSNLSDAALQGALDWVCGPLPAQGQVNCFPVQSGQNCFLPDTVQSHASWAFNVYFQNHNATDDACDFQGTATQVYTDPSSSTCAFVGSTKEINGTISNGTVTPSPPNGIFSTGAAANFKPQFLIHLVAAVGMLMTPLLT